MKNTENWRIPYAIAGFLESEAYRIRIVTDFEKSKALFANDLIKRAILYIKGSNRNGTQACAQDRVKDIAAGNFELIELDGGESPDGSKDGFDNYCRAIKMKIADREVELQFMTLDSIHDGCYHAKWLESHAPTTAFIESSPGVDEILQDMFSVPQQDFFQRECPMGGEYESNIYGRIEKHLEEVREANGLPRLHTYTPDNSPSP